MFILWCNFNSSQLYCQTSSYSSYHFTHVCIPSFAAPLHVDLVRCVEYPEKEGEYKVLICPSSYKIWSSEFQWEWHMNDIERIHWHPKHKKLEVEAQR